MSVASALGCGAAFLRHLSTGSRSGSTLMLLRAGRTKPRQYSSSPARCAAPEPPDVSRLADTARISLTPEEVEQFAPKIRQVVDWFGQLQAVDLDSVEPSLRAVGFQMYNLVIKIFKSPNSMAPPSMIHEQMVLFLYLQILMLAQAKEKMLQKHLGTGRQL